MTAARRPAWDDTEIAGVPAAELSAAIGLWLARERAGIVLIDAARFSTLEQIEARIIAMHDHPARGLAVLTRVRCLVKALSLRRFRHLVKPENAAELATLIGVVAQQRLSARWGISPLRLAWALSAAEGAKTDALAA